MRRDVKQHIVGERLRWARLRRKITQTRLAQIVGVHRLTISRLEQDKSHAESGVGLVLGLSEHLGVAARWLIGQREDWRRGERLTSDERELLAAYRGHDGVGKSLAVQAINDLLDAMRSSKALSEKPRQREPDQHTNGHSDGNCD